MRPSSLRSTAAVLRRSAIRAGWWAAPLLIAMVLLLVSAGARAGAIGAADAQPRVMLVQVHADWCPACRVLTPRVQALADTLAASDALVVQLDYTNAQTTRQANLLATALGISDVVAANNGTGTLLVIRSADRSLARVLTRRDDDAAIVAAARSAGG